MKSVSDGNGNEIKVVAVECFLEHMGYLNPEETRVKFLLTCHIENLIADLGLSHAEAAEKTDLPAEFSVNAIAGKVEDISVWQLMRALDDLGAVVDIAIRLPRAGKTIIEIAP
ncbi:hypothetical protein SAE02_77530 [Skermanella aerolata]|uniref:HigA2-like helix-turn-helix domain-containing protein n=1 Tax=Skermanella aerolata TaxID=393310 RepID=A0A512E4E5_9PROT|nr:XRE family transcriptional regulator [Skermanella aerolata]KJB89988.1 hypothetical protein N826_08730 [Skermanella aerolata KACC 11604]GEO43605.1 hypothetical protein SAE02_77530 [Skermanella aerolata]